MKRQIGAHLSTSGGIHKAIERAHEIGCNCVQVFSGSPRMWRRTPLDKIDVEKLFSKQKDLGVKPIYTHALYLVNLASDKPELLDKSMMALKHDLEFDSYVKGSGVIVHLGSHQGRGWEAVKDQLVEKITDLLKQTPNDSKLLIENSAGQNGKIASNLEEIKWLLDEVRANLSSQDQKRLGWCFDTCHGFAAGYYLGTQAPPAGAKEDLFSEKKNTIEEVSRLGLWEDLACIHVNDTRDDFASGRDRHANLGEGNIDQDDLKYFLNHEKVSELPLLLEVPGEEKSGPDKANVKKLKQLIK